MRSAEIVVEFGEIVSGSVLAKVEDTGKTGTD